MHCTAWQACVLSVRAQRKATEATGAPTASIAIAASHPLDLPALHNVLLEMVWLESLTAALLRTNCQTFRSSSERCMLLSNNLEYSGDNNGESAVWEATRRINPIPERETEVQMDVMQCALNLTQSAQVAEWERSMKSKGVTVLNDSSGSCIGTKTDCNC